MLNNKKLYKKLTIAPIVLACLFIAACSTKKIATKGGAEKELARKEKRAVLEQVENSLLSFETFSTKARTKLSIDNKSFSSTLAIRIKQNEAIWISATAFLGIEAARILITPERIQIINRLESTYLDKPFEYIYNFTSRELSFKELQDLFVGNRMSFTVNPLNAVLSAGTDYRIIGAMENLEFEALVDPEYRISQTTLTESQKNQTLQVNYEGYSNVNEKIIPNTVNININAPKTKINASMKYEDVVFNQELSIPFSVPERYKKI